MKTHSRANVRNWIWLEWLIFDFIAFKMKNFFSKKKLNSSLCCLSHIGLYVHWEQLCIVPSFIQINLHFFLFISIVSERCITCSRWAHMEPYIEEPEYTFKLHGKTLCFDAFERFFSLFQLRFRSQTLQLFFVFFPI